MKIMDSIYRLWFPQLVDNEVEDESLVAAIEEIEVEDTDRKSYFNQEHLFPPESKRKYD